MPKQLRSSFSYVPPFRIANVARFIARPMMRSRAFSIECARNAKGRVLEPKVSLYGQFLHRGSSRDTEPRKSRGFQFNAMSDWNHVRENERDHVRRASSAT